MTNQEKRIAILTAWGWTTQDGVWRSPEQYVWRESGMPPDPINNLNALAEAEQACLTTDELLVKWVDNLRAVQDKPVMHFVLEVAHMMRLPCDKRADALLRTLDLWIDS